MRTHGKMNKEVLGERQQMIMQCVWETDGNVTIQEITERMERKCGIAFSKASINTLVLMLVERGYLTQGPKIHQAFTFRALISEAEYQRKEIKRVGDAIFGGSPSNMLVALIDNKVSKEELAKMREIIDNCDE